MAGCCSACRRATPRSGWRAPLGPPGEPARSASPLARPAARVCAVSYRRDVLFQQIATSRSAEHMLIGAAMIEATTFRAIREVVPSVRDVRVPLGGAGRLHCVVALHEPLPGEAQRAVFA